MLYGILLTIFAVSTALIMGPSDSIPITVSGTMNEVNFDGKWSFMTEWKPSSLNTYNYNDDQVVLRSAHQGDFVYILVDMLTDQSLDLGKDEAAVCFDSNNDKSSSPNLDDYCFLVKLGSETPQTFQGDPNSGSVFKEIMNSKELKGVSSASDENDRYSSVPHSSYEFKIPTSVIGRNSEYGFYFSVYDDTSKKLFTYPTNVTSFLPQHHMLSAPKEWGTIYSPDKSLPEFQLPLLALLASISIIILISKKSSHFKY